METDVSSPRRNGSGKRGLQPQASLSSAGAAASPRAAGDATIAIAALKTAAADGRRRTLPHAVGVASFGAFCFLAGAAPWVLPVAFLVFAATALPARLVAFVRKRWVFFTIDFCYWVNLAAAALLLFAPEDPRAETLVYALADGPLAGALPAWQCAWVFGDSEHVTSVLMHLLPGLAIFAHRHYTPPALRGWRGLARCSRALAGAAAAATLPLNGGSRSSASGPLSAAAGVCFGARPGAPPPRPPAPPPRPEPLWGWLVAAPLCFYVCWQLGYFLIVQVAFRGFIQRGGYDTSYNCLARRAAKTNNFWNRLVRRGSIARRVLMYGSIQFAFTAICLSVFIPTYFSFPLALAYQALKLWFPILHGARHTCEKTPNRLLRQALGFTTAGAAAGGGGAGGLRLPPHAHVQVSGLARTHSLQKGPSRRSVERSLDGGDAAASSAAAAGAAGAMGNGAAALAPAFEEDGEEAVSGGAAAANGSLRRRAAAGVGAGERAAR